MSRDREPAEAGSFAPASARAMQPADAPVAQLDRVSVFETEGCPFEPGRARQTEIGFLRYSINGLRF